MPQPNLLKSFTGINPFKFYRLDFCLRNLGLGMIGIAAGLDRFNCTLALIALINIFLIQAYSFSANNYYDYQIFGELNYIAQLRARGISLKLCFAICLLPLVLLAGILAAYPSYAAILFLYLLLFYCYQTPPFRLKNNYLLSILINAVCLGSILILYPHLFINQKLNALGAYFAVLYFCHLAFFELIHQIAHLGRDQIMSLPAKIGIGGTANAIKIFQLLIIFLALAGWFMLPAEKLIFITTLLFSLLRLRKLLCLPALQDNFLKLRERPDRFYALWEGLCYLAALAQ